MIVNKLLAAMFFATGLIAGNFFFWPQAALAHRFGCHNLHTCPSDKSSYVCGDLGYPCDGSTSAADIAITAINVPLVVEKAFTDTFGRRPTEAENKYWISRVADKRSFIGRHGLAQNK